MSLSETAKRVIERHFFVAGFLHKARVPQGPRHFSVYDEASGRLWVHDDSPRKSGAQHLYFYSIHSVTGTLTCSHPIKLWDLMRTLTPRETARLQGFPDVFITPDLHYNQLLGNAVSVPCAAHACSLVLDASERITYIDMCAGIGGFSYAVREVCPHVVGVGFSEIKQDAVRCFSANFPSVPALGDATQVDSWPTCDLLTAGFPCQPFSRATHPRHRACHEDVDFFKVVLHALKKTSAKRFVFENVMALQTVGVHTWTTLQNMLKSMGFAITYRVLDSVDFGLPQHRKRLYIVGRRDGVVLRPWGACRLGRRATLKDIIDK